MQHILVIKRIGSVFADSNGVKFSARDLRVNGYCAIQTFHTLIDLSFYVTFVSFGIVAQ